MRALPNSIYTQCSLRERSSRNRSLPHAAAERITWRMPAPRTPSGGLANLEADIAATKKRLTAAKSSRDALYRQYLECRSTIDALGFELERLEKTRTSVEAADATDTRELMAELGITFDGSEYRCGGRGYA